MKHLYLFLIVAALAAAPSLLLSQDPKPPNHPPDEAALKEIAEQTDRLDKAVAALRRQGVGDPWLADIEVCHKAAAWIVRHQEFYHPDAGRWTREALDLGLLRASQMARGDMPWAAQTGHAVVHGYRSRIDGSIQPYAITLPADYGKDLRKKWRVDVVLHGRDLTLTEVKFLHEHNGEKAVPREQDFVQLDIYGRGNNAYRWAGETDVWEAIDSFATEERSLGREPLLDPYRFVLRGFSMGGGGTWHLGLHHPHRWCVLGPGAGFTTTHGFLKDLPEKLPSYQEACLHIYDAADYAENAFDVPVVAYAGSKDPQLQAARTIEERLKPFDISIKLLVAPDLVHTFPPEWQKKAEQEYARYAAADKGLSPFPEHVRFVTYTLKYPACAWVQVLGLDQHYERTLVDAEKTETGYNVKTSNVRALRFALPGGAPQPLVIAIDGENLNARPYLSQDGTVQVTLERRGGHWNVVLPQKLLTEQLRHLQKITGLQGPIDDAFMDSFLCVRGTGKPWHEATQQYAENNLKRFRDEWDRYLRGELPIKDDVDVTEEDIAAKHLVLFGDPASNSLIAQVVDGMPLTWTRDSLGVDGKTYPAAEHVPVLIYPSPLNSRRYVLLNTGHTFHAADLQGSNALLYPRLGDYAVLRLSGTDKDPLDVQVVLAGLFDDFWQFKKSGQ